MLHQYKTFLSVVIFFLITSALVLTMYTYTIETSLSTVKQDIQTSNLNRLHILINSVDFNVEQLNMLAVAMNADPKMGLLKSIDLMDHYERDQLLLDLSDKVNLQSFAKGWDIRLAIYSHSLSRWIGSGQHTLHQPNDIQEGSWQLESSTNMFAMYRDYGHYMIRVTFSVNNLLQMLNSAKVEINDPFFYHPDAQVISNRYSNTELIEELITQISPWSTGRMEGTELVSIEGTDYMVSFLRSERLGWYMIDYVPLDQALQPIVRTQVFFYITCAVLLITGIITIIFLYRKVQVPILTLLKGVRQLKNGDFSHRIDPISHNEFGILYVNFNDMAQQIEELIEKVYKEKIISREALVKQLQAQINPHFLYNCLFFINNMNRLGNDEAVTAMTQNLAEYFRYTTRLNDPLTTLDKELGVVRNYLNIQCLRMDRLQYDIDIPDTMLSVKIPKLLIQPLVENSAIHGIEQKQSAGMIRISGIIEGNQYRLFVDDDGKGMTPAEIRDLLDRLEQPPDDQMGSALWNIRQRMLIQLGSEASLHIDHSPLGGLRIELNWTVEQQPESEV